MISKKTWLRFSTFAFISFIAWFCLTYPQLSFIDLSIDKKTAINIAKAYLIEERGDDITGYSYATIFVSTPTTDQYLQKSLGYKEELNFLRRHDHELFFWRVRFYRENEKDEFNVRISAATGEIIGFVHKIKANAARPGQDEETAKQKVIQFLKTKFNFNPDNYVLKGNLSTEYDNRTNYHFSWAKKNVFVKWTDEKDSGSAKLITGATISGDEILSFYKQKLDIPNQFSRFLERQKNVGRNLAVFFRISFYLLLTASIFYVIIRRNDIVTHTIKKFCLGLTGFLFILHLLSYINNFESILYQYRTTSSFASYLWRNISGFFLDAFIVTIGILMPSLAGESLRYEVFPQKKKSSFLHYLTTTFFSRDVFQMIVLGYLVAMIMIGIQSSAFAFGQNYLGVWVEYSWMAMFSTCYIPFLSAFIIGASASLSEEIAFRLFSINLGKKFLKNTFLAVLIASIVWGYGHSTYAVFPMWFRGLEVTCLGLFLSFVYLRYGIIPVIIAHFLFDVFWSSAAYLLGTSPAYHFYSSLAVLLLPLAIGGIAYFMNRPVKERTLGWQLNKHQKYNLNILKEFLRNHHCLANADPDEIKKEIISHGWDLAVVEMAIKDITEGKGRV
ncbi:MAG: CPBP family intramembrane metalloprotease [Candidatus Omnitrophica bacterium]|nr:CPBP family intramembrane metalloprotease [Candidatus Omnitrophota bacterium]